MHLHLFANEGLPGFIWRLIFNGGVRIPAFFAFVLFKIDTILLIMLSAAAGIITLIEEDYKNLDILSFGFLFKGT